jgi:hypothetical protein
MPVSPTGQSGLVLEGLQGERAPRRFAVAVVLATSIGLTGALAGCTSATPHVKASATPSTQTALVPLLPNYPKKLTAANARTESVRIADQVQQLIASTDIVHIDDKSQLVAKTKTAGAYYGVIRAITLSPNFDSETQASAMAKLLVTAGWTQRQESNKSGVYAVALTADGPAGTAILLLKSDETSVKIPAISILLESPDLPK